MPTGSYSKAEGSDRTDSRLCVTCDLRTLVRTRSGLRDTRSTRLCGTARSIRDNTVRSTRHTVYETLWDSPVYTRQHGPVYETHGLQDSEGQHGLHETTRSGLRHSVFGTLRDTLSTQDSTGLPARHTVYKNTSRQHGLSTTTNSWEEVGLPSQHHPFCVRSHAMYSGHRQRKSPQRYAPQQYNNAGNLSPGTMSNRMTVRNMRTPVAARHRYDADPRPQPNARQPSP